MGEPLAFVAVRARAYRDAKEKAEVCKELLRGAVLAARAAGYSLREIETAAGYVITNVTVHNWQEDRVGRNPDAVRRR